ncbi:MAG: isoprenylcysteine carboxylmethyltransferase family protein [Pirellula sp.]|nr:isoprenylcysteine carboxylmethyltransferase family protein [Pirellula sp.]
MPLPSNPNVNWTKRSSEWWNDPSRSSWILDTFERGTMLVLFGWFVVALTSSIITTWTLESNVVIGDFMLLITEAMVIVFVLLRRKAKTLSLRFSDWFLAYAASCLPLLARPDHSESHFWDGGAVPLTILGLTLILYAKLTLGRRFGLVAANRGVCDTGPYRFVRHPIYFGYLLLHVGFLMLSPTLWNAIVFATFYALLIPRIFAEERVLGEDDQYRIYMSKVKSRLIPGFF